MFHVESCMLYVVCCVLQDSCEYRRYRDRREEREVVRIRALEKFL